MATTDDRPWGFRAQLARVHDGDSFWVLADLGFGCRAEFELRLDGVHAPELTEPGGRETTEFVNGWLSAQGAAGRRWPLWLGVTQTTSFEPGMRQSFTRYVATVWAYEHRGPGQSVNELVNIFLSGHPEWPDGF
jgi:endonuclease YncB( thermonuclease family)